MSIVLSMYFNDLSFDVVLVIDIMDCNFYECVNDCWWWVLILKFIELIDLVY